ILSKSPALSLVPAVGLIALLGIRRQGDGALDVVAASPARRFAHSLVIPLLAWAAVVVVTIFAFLPALWVCSLGPYQQMRLGVEAEGGGTHVSGNFFLGREDDRPGPLFYPVALGLTLAASQLV